MPRAESETEHLTQLFEFSHLQRMWMHSKFSSWFLHECKTIQISHWIHVQMIQILAWWGRLVGDRICARSTSTPVQCFASSGAQTSDFETWPSALPLVGIYFALPLDCLTSHATRWEQIMMTCLLFRALLARLKSIWMYFHTSLFQSPG